eukprot:CAMPEP_0185796300 /NCGR_PEP_ID=MMETSP1174-20130828/161008_1 /TAXON_ID=35687 /ORGANISM="Dictyocha speculum, Strain CCMP1381" /LENGTH=161 /DNA_ID=CAMNT_0028491653 /DNA_START=704 /DNA_END=1189 /DNA_ORIENTATION=-
MAEYSLCLPQYTVPGFGGHDIVSDLWVPLGTLFFGLFCGALGVFIVLDIHAEWLISSKGYGEPLPLSRTEHGWAPSGQEKGYELCLGMLDKNVLIKKPQQQVANKNDKNNKNLKTNNVRDFELVVPVDDYDSTGGSGYDSAVFNDLYNTGNVSDSLSSSMG